MMNVGFLPLGTWGGTALRVHWTAPLGAFFFSGFRGAVSPIRRACIAWGGVWMQLVALAVTLVVVAIAGGRPEPGTALRDVYFVLVFVNGWIIALNLVPVRPLDGAEAWPLCSLLWRRRRDRGRRDRVARARVHRS